MEDTHVTDLDKIEKIIFVLTIAFCWAYRMGELNSSTSPILKKAHGRKAKSFFRHGLDLIRRAIWRIKTNFEEFLDALSCLKLGTNYS